MGHDGQVRNAWNVYGYEAVVWVVTLGPPTPAPGPLGAWHHTALLAGEQTGVYQVLAVPDARYQRDADGPAPAFGERHGDLGPMWVVDHHHTAATRLAYVGSGGEPVERDVSDLGAMPDAAPAERRPHRPPLTLHGSLDERTGAVEVRVASYTDLWLPWVRDWQTRPRPTYDDVTDNLDSARRNGARLNALLAALGEAAAATGGGLALHPDTDGNLLPMLRDSGVALDAPRPRERVAIGWPDGQRRDGLLASIREGVRELRQDPAAPDYRQIVRLFLDDPAHELTSAGPAAIRAALRNPDDPSARLRHDDLADLAAVEVDNERGRFSFTPGDLAP
jgi:hypothetical protein